MMNEGGSFQQRVARLVWLMAQGGEYSTPEIARIMNMRDRSGAWRMMHRLKTVIPLIPPDEKGGRWRLAHEHAVNNTPIE